MDSTWASVLVAICLLVGLWLVGDFEGSVPSYRDLTGGAKTETRDEPRVAQDNPHSAYMAVSLPLPGIEKPETATVDVWDVLTVEVRRHIFKREWYARRWVNDYVGDHYPIDEGSLLRGDMDAWQESFDKNEEMFERVYYVEFEAPICEEFDVPSWMIHQIVVEGLEEGWHCGLPGAICP